MGKLERRLRRMKVRGEAKEQAQLSAARPDEELSHEERERAKALTKRGLCSRCALPSGRHPDGNCPDGGGSFTWAMGREDMEAMVQRLESLQAEAKRAPALTRDEQLVLDTVTGLVLGVEGNEDAGQFAAASMLLGSEQERPQLSPQLVSEKTGLPLHHVRALLDSLVDKGMLSRGPKGGLS